MGTLVRGLEGGYGRTGDWRCCTGDCDGRHAGMPREQRSQDAQLRFAIGVEITLDSFVPGRAGRAGNVRSLRWRRRHGFAARTRGSASTPSPCGRPAAVTQALGAEAGYRSSCARAGPRGCPRPAVPAAACLPRPHASHPDGPERQSRRGTEKESPNELRGLPRLERRGGSLAPTRVVSRMLNCLSALPRAARRGDGVDPSPGPKHVAVHSSVRSPSPLSPLEAPWCSQRGRSADGVGERVGLLGAGQRGAALLQSGGVGGKEGTGRLDQTDGGGAEARGSRVRTLMMKKGTPETRYFSRHASTSRVTWLLRESLSSASWASWRSRPTALAASSRTLMSPTFSSRSNWRAGEMKGSRRQEGAEEVQVAARRT